MVDNNADHRRRSALLAGSYLAAGLVVGVLIGLIAGSWALGAVIGLLAGAAVVAAAYTAGPGRVLRRIHAETGDERRLARLANLVEGLCVTHGVDRPEVRVIDDPGINAAVVGTDPKHSTIAVTTGMLDQLSRIELEAVVAHLLARIRTGEVGPATLAAVLFGGVPLRRAVLGSGADLRADASAWRMTRYPPGLIGALQKIRQGSSTVRSASSFGTQLWFADPLERTPDAPGDGGVRRLFDAHAPIEQRIVLLQEV